MAGFFDKLNELSPGADKEIHEMYLKATRGKIKNPFQWMAIKFAMETEYSKAVQKSEMQLTSPVQIKYVQAENIANINHLHLNATEDNNESLSPLPVEDTDGEGEIHSGDSGSPER